MGTGEGDRDPRSCPKLGVGPYPQAGPPQVPVAQGGALLLPDSGPQVSLRQLYRLKLGIHRVQGKPPESRVSRFQMRLGLF